MDDVTLEEVASFVVEKDLTAADRKRLQDSWFAMRHVLAQIHGHRFSWDECRVMIAEAMKVGNGK